MEYYKVIKDAQTYNNGRWYTLVKDELLTAADVKKYKAPLHLLQAVQVKRTRTFWSFGARFELKVVRVVKDCASLKQAESYQNRLYNRFDGVELIAWPRHSEAGTYIWDCQ